jgi:hypothetical protein
LHTFPSKEGVNRALDETGIKIAMDALRDASRIHEERPKSVYNGVGSFGAEAVGPGVSGSKVDEGKAILVPPWTDTFAVSNVHPNCVESMCGTSKEAAMAVSGDSSHVANSERGVSFLVDV